MSPVRRVLLGAALVVVSATLIGLAAPAASAQQPDPDVPTPSVELPELPEVDLAVPDPTPGSDIDLEDTDGDGVASLNVTLGGEDGDVPSQSIVLLLVLTVISVAPSLVVMLTSFTRMVIVFSLVRNAIGLQTVPPNQVVVGLSLFLSLFVMSPTLEAMNEDGLQPYLAGELDQGQAFEAATTPLREFMLANTGHDELELMLAAEADGDVDPQAPESPDDISLVTLIPAFILSELKTAFIIGFVVFVPFLVIDLVVSSVLMSLGMMMLPPVFVSLPFKILLFVMVDGWSLIAETLITSFNT